MQAQHHTCSIVRKLKLKTRDVVRYTSYLRYILITACGWTTPIRISPIREMQISVLNANSYETCEWVLHADEGRHVFAYMDFYSGVPDAQLQVGHVLR